MRSVATSQSQIQVYFQRDSGLLCEILKSPEMGLGDDLQNPRSEGPSPRLPFLVQSLHVIFKKNFRTCTIMAFPEDAF